MTTYRNTRTDETHEPEPGSWMDERLAGLPDIWEPIESVPDPASSPPRPARMARKSDWVDYAMSRGYSREDAEGLSRDDLARLFDDPDEA
jgi:hypothetical protein